MAKPAILAVMALAISIPWRARAQVADELAGSTAAPDVIPSDGSMGPVFINRGDETATLLGINVGNTCAYSNAADVVRVSSGYTSCSQDIAIFAPWRNMAENFGLTGGGAR